MTVFNAYDYDVMPQSRKYWTALVHGFWAIFYMNISRDLLNIAHKFTLRANDEKHATVTSFFAQTTILNVV